MTNQNRRILIVFISFVFSLSLFATATFLDISREAALTKERDTMTLLDLKTQLDRSLIDRLRLTEGISAFVINARTTEKALLDPFLNNLVDLKDPVFRNIAIMKGTTIGYQYPLKGNEKSIGVDLLTIPEQREAVLRSMATLESTINGPIELVQGGNGIVMRVPITQKTSDPPTFWGLISVVLKYEELINEVMANTDLEDHHIGIYQLDRLGNVNNTIYESEGLKQKEGSSNHPSVYADVPVMTDVWRLQVSRDNPRGLPLASYFFVVFGFMVSSAVAYLLNKWMLQRNSLNGEVEERTKQLRETNVILEQYVAEFEESQAELELMNGQLEASLSELKQTQDQLVVTEKLAALGDLVGSLAHEINTPLGVCVTLYSFIEENFENFRIKHIEVGQALSRIDLESFLEDNKEALVLMGHNLKRSSELVASFKLVSMDQYLEEYRILNLAEYIDEIVNSIRPKYKRIDNLLSIYVDPDIRMYTYPGAISQILTNLINNSIIHGFNGQQDGEIKILIEKKDEDYITFVYTDSGIGLDQEGKDNIFKPFYTTKKHKGSSGIGMHIVHNAVINTLGGEVTLLTEQNGFGVKITLPVRVERDV